MSGVERFGSNLTLLSLSFTRRGDGNLTLSLCDVPLLHKERELRPLPTVPLPQKGEGRFGESQNRVRSGRWARNSRLNKESNLTLSASQTSLSFTKERELRPLPTVPLLHKERDVLAVAKTG